MAAGGAGWAIAIDGATYAVSALCLARLRLPTVPSPARESFLVQLRTGWSEFRTRTWLWAIVTQFGLFHLLVYAPFMVLGAVVANTTLGGATAWGFILTAQGAGAILGGHLHLRRAPPRPCLTARGAAAHPLHDTGVASLPHRRKPTGPPATRLIGPNPSEHPILPNSARCSHA